MGKRAIAWRAAVAGGLALALAACGGGETADPAPRTVLVVQPAALAGGTPGAFAGEVHARQESALSFRLGGNLVRRLVDAGEHVRKDQLLAELDAGDSRLQVEAARADMQRLGGDLERYRALLARKLVSQSAFDAQQAAWRAARAQYELMRNQAGYARLLAPRDGVIASRQAEAGQVVAAGQAIFVLAADGEREVAISLPESRIRDFSTGQKAVVEPWNAPGLRLPGQIREIAAAADPQTRTYAARVAIDGDAAGQVELGQSARVYIAGTTEGEALQVPLAAVQRGGDGGASLWVVDASGTVHARAVRLGAYGDDSVPVLSGVRGDDWVVAGGGHLLREGERVRAVDRRNRPVQAPAPAKAG